MAETVDTNSFKNGSHVEIDGSIYRIVEFQHVKPGKGGAFVRTKLRRLDDGGVIEGSDFAGTFGHGLGHGLGLDVHESPRLSTESSDTLAAGNLVTVEPGVYLEGRFGIRIEDDVIVTDEGIENPVGFTKELLTVG